ncbi:site-2 protease family protein [Leptolyngbya sp. FACHB-711]|uniref:site-2 protease family protein n=1 Tax=unclassified Leptolyngbya TaxID=2650499 RepID=UPI001687BA8C|nr:site-2 protease family protein [Leptolyngbya sp. FACHB-711]MBD1853600.1 site-2 protease family protein [Cyanobacteria bacterium FACHB-502]MBD2027871.1 site-2 protease family protein [Leptolyngbya sp. FACHB-711]
MRSGWQVGRIFGIPLLLDQSWFWILALISFQYGTIWQREGWGGLLPWFAGFAMALLLFGSVLLHELGHSLIARSQGINVTSIRLFLFGGIASIEQESKTPGQAFQVAIAGPAVSFSIFLVLSLLRLALPLPEPAEAVIGNLAGINFVLALFNMIPGLPLDGGQVLKAAVWKATGSRAQGVRWAARAGQTLAWTAVIVGIFSFFSTMQLSYLWLALLGWFGVQNASTYSRVTDLQEALAQLTAAQAMTREFRVVEAEMTLREFADKYLLNEMKLTVYYAAADGRYRGLVAPERMQTIERSSWDSAAVQELVDPLSEIPAVAENTSLIQVIDRLETETLRRITVLSPAGAVAGVIDRGDIVRALAEKLKIALPEDVINRIKEEGAFPPGLQLQEIAKSAGGDR